MAGWGDVLGELIHDLLVAIMVTETLLEYRQAQFRCGLPPPSFPGSPLPTKSGAGTVQPVRAPAGGRGHSVADTGLPCPSPGTLLCCFHFILPPPSFLSFLAQLVLCHRGYKFCLLPFPNLPVTLSITKHGSARQALPSSLPVGAP